MRYEHSNCSMTGVSCGKWERHVQGRAQCDLSSKCRKTADVCGSIFQSPSVLRRDSRKRQDWETYTTLWNVTEGMWKVTPKRTFMWHPNGAAPHEIAVVSRSGTFRAAGNHHTSHASPWAAMSQQSLWIPFLDSCQPFEPISRGHSRAITAIGHQRQSLNG